MKSLKMSVSLLVLLLSVMVVLLGCDGDKGTGGGGSSSYESVVIDGKTWMKKNLNIATADSWCYDNSADSCAKYGRLYTWNAAMKVCPGVWRLPTLDDWVALVVAAGGTGFHGSEGPAGNALKSTSGWDFDGNGTDQFGFSALPGGSRSYGSSFVGAGWAGSWWTATEYPGNFAYNLWMVNDRDDVDVGSTTEKYIARSVRCIKD
jgi:uncharacterized protein (TIGR02145 family)